MLTGTFDVRVDRARTRAAADEQVTGQRYALILVNRVFFHDGASGHEFLDYLRSIGNETPTMLISNYADAQKQAVARGARPGFGKAALHERQTLTLLAECLPIRESAGGRPAVETKA